MNWNWQEVRRDLLIGAAICLVLAIIFCGGCTSRGDVGELFSMELGLSVGKNATIATTAKDDSVPGGQLVGHEMPATVAAKNADERRGFRTLEVNRD